MLTPKSGDQGAGFQLYHGPDRRRRLAPLPRLLVSVLDEVDYGLLVVTRDGWVLHGNHLAKQALQAGHPLVWAGQRLQCRSESDAQKFLRALVDACDKQMRSLLTLGEPDDAHVEFSVVPLPPPDDAPENGASALIKLARRELVQDLSVAAFSRANGLSAREQDVLLHLCRGRRPQEIAERLSISLATVRSHAHNLRHKVGASDVPALVQMVAVMPPMVSALRFSGAEARAKAEAA